MDTRCVCRRRENDVAVALHLDDSMGWGERKDLLSNPDNIESADWKQIPNKARSLQWGVSPTKFPPQMCYNAPAIVAAAKDRAGLIGAEIKRELAALKSQGKEQLFAGVIAGSETQIGREFGTNRPLGFRALAHRGFSERNPPKDLDAERVSVVKEWMELWANALHVAGIPREKIFCHIAFTDQGLRKADAKESYAEKVAFALPEVAFSSAYRPGFSTYPEGRTFKEVYAVLEKHGSPGWISAEGTNVSPTSMPGEPTMETYLGRVFNHGGVLVNVFSWGIGGEAQRNNFFRKATENAEALAAYAKFLRGEKLVESATGFASEAFHAKMRRIQMELPDWVQKSGKQAQVMPLAQKLQTLIKDKKWQEADQLADELLELMKGDQPKGEKKDSPSLQERLPAKIQTIQKELPAWVQKEGDKEKAAEATALMKKLEGHLKAKHFEEAEKTADSILKLMGVSAQAAAQEAKTEGQPTADSWERERCLTEGPGPRKLAFNFARCVAADEAGRVHVVWYETRDGKEHAFYKRSPDEGKTWEAEVSLSDTSERMRGSEVLPAIAAAGPNVYAVWHERRKGGVNVYFRRSIDGGKNWEPPVKLTDGPTPSAFASVAALGSDVHVVFVDMGPKGFGYTTYRRSTDAGATWEAAKGLPDKPSKPSVSYVPCIHASGSDVFLAWVDTRDLNEEEYVKVSHDRGATWGKDVRLTNHPGNSWASSLAASGKVVHLVWFDQMDSPIQPADAEKKLDAVMKLLGLPPHDSGPGGHHVPNPETVAKNRAAERMQMIQKERKAWVEKGGDEKGLQRILSEYDKIGQALDKEEKLDEAIKLMGLKYTPGPQTDVPLIEHGAARAMRVQFALRKVKANTPAWVQKGGDPKKLDMLVKEFHQAMDRATTDWEIYYRRSTDRGDNWGPTVRLTNAPGVSHRPSVAVAGNDVHVVWWDDRDGNSEVYYKHSADGGLKWGEDVRLTNAPGASQFPSVAVSRNFVHVVWLESRDGSPQIYYLRKSSK